MKKLFSVLLLFVVLTALVSCTIGNKEPKETTEIVEAKIVAILDDYVIVEVTTGWVSTTKYEASVLSGVKDLLVGSTVLIKIYYHDDEFYRCEIISKLK